MNITITDAAQQEINRRAGDQPFALTLLYDTEGCGCAVNGIAALRLTTPDADPGAFLEIGGSPYTCLINPAQEVFFEEQLHLDYRPNRTTFVLSSNNQIYNNDIPLVDQRA